MNILVLGLNHKTASVEIREKLAFDRESCVSSMKTLKQQPEIKEILILSTCNRVEIYSVVNDIEAGAERIIDYLAEFHQINKETIKHALYRFTIKDAIRHVFRVASSLDSMVVGEPQILGQLKDFFDIAIKEKATGVILNRFIRKAISVAKRVRTETAIAQNAVSISFAAVELAKSIFGSLANTSFMLLGAGEMAELAAKHLLNNGISSVVIANRTFGRAVELAKQFGGRAVPFDNFKRELLHADIVISSTGARDYVIKKQEMTQLMKERKYKQMFIIDISVPRNIDPEINAIDNVYLYDIDDLQGVVDANINERRTEAQKAEVIVESEIESFFQWYDCLDSAPSILALRKKAESIRTGELEKAMKRLNGIGEKEFKTIEAMTKAIVNKLIHPPTELLRSTSENNQETIALIRKLYALEDGNDNGG
jgi:glutamyl-tRNA reductase